MKSDIKEIIKNIKEKNKLRQKECRICGEKLKNHASCFCDECRTLSRAELAEIVFMLRKK